MSIHSEMVIIGGGVIGLACAWKLAKAGKHVTVLERNQCGSGASSAALGALWASTAVHTNVHEMHHQSLRDMPLFCHELELESNIACGYKQCGRIELISKPSRSEQIQNEIKTNDTINRLWDITPVMELISIKQLRAIEPYIQIIDESILQCHITAKLNPLQLIKSLKQSCLKNGVVIHENCNADDIKFTDNKVHSIITSQETYHPNQVMITAGAWIRFIHDRLHQEAPVKPVRGQGIRFQCNEQYISRVIKKDSIYLIPKENQQIIVGSTTEMNSGFDENTTDEGIEQLRQGAFDLVPDLKNAEMINAWAGLRPMGMDKRPFLGQSPVINNLYFAAGFFKTGLGMAPVVSEIMRDLICGNELNYDISRLQPGRVSVKKK